MLYVNDSTNSIAMDGNPVITTHSLSIYIKKRKKIPKTLNHCTGAERPINSSFFFFFDILKHVPFNFKCYFYSELRYFVFCNLQIRFLSSINPEPMRNLYHKTVKKKKTRTEWDINEEITNWWRRKILSFLCCNSCETVSFHRLNLRFMACVWEKKNCFAIEIAKTIVLVIKKNGVCQTMKPYDETHNN